MFLLVFYEKVREATLAGEKRPVGVATREAQLWLRDATLTDILGRVQVRCFDIGELWLGVDGKMPVLSTTFRRRLRG